MPLNRPRRIFRSGSLGSGGGGLARTVPHTVLAGLVGAVLGAGTMLLALPATIFGRASDLGATIAAEPAQVAVVDGETLRLNGTVIRLKGVDAPARGRTCRDAEGFGYDCGAAASEALARLVRGRTVSCRVERRDAQGFPEGICLAAAGNLNRDLIAWLAARTPTTAPR